MLLVFDIMFMVAWCLNPICEPLKRDDIPATGHAFP